MPSACPPCTPRVFLWHLSGKRPGFRGIGKLGFQWLANGALRELSRRSPSGLRRIAMYYYFLPLESMACAIQLASYLLTLVTATFAFLWVRP